VSQLSVYLGAVSEGEKPTIDAVQIPGEELQTRDILASTLRDECDLELA
jgi:hypothetical protein